MATGLEMVEPEVEASSWPDVVESKVKALNKGLP